MSPPSVSGGKRARINTSSELRQTPPDENRKRPRVDPMKFLAILMSAFVAHNIKRRPPPPPDPGDKAVVVQERDKLIVPPTTPASDVNVSMTDVENLRDLHETFTDAVQLEMAANTLLCMKN